MFGVRNRRLGQLIVVVAIMLVLAGCSSQTPPTTTVQAQPPAPPSTTPARGGDARFEQVAPARAVDPLAETGDRVSGLWSWTVDENGSSYIEHSAANGTPTGRWNLTPPSNGGPAGGAAVSLRQAPNGDIWLGTQMTLVRLDPQTSKVSQWAIPSAPVSAIASAARPPSIATVQYVTDFDFRPGNTVVISLADASSLVTFDPRTQAFGQLALPTVGEATAVATASDGTLAVGMSNYQSHTWDTVVIVHPDGTTKTVTTGSWFVKNGPSGFIAGFDTLNRVDENGTITPVALPVGEKVNTRVPPGLLPDGRVVFAGVGTVSVVDPSGRAQPQTVDLGTEPCGVGEGSHTGGPQKPVTTVAPNNCSTPPAFLTVDGAGNFFAQSHGRGLRRAKAGSL